MAPLATRWFLRILIDNRVLELHLDLRGAGAYFAIHSFQRYTSNELDVGMQAFLRDEWKEIILGKGR